MTVLSLALSVLAFGHLLYAMLRPEKF